MYRNTAQYKGTKNKHHLAVAAMGGLGVSTQQLSTSAFPARYESRLSLSHFAYAVSCVPLLEVWDDGPLCMASVIPVLRGLCLPAAQPVTSRRVAFEQRRVLHLGQLHVTRHLGVLAPLALPAPDPVAARDVAPQQDLSRIRVVVDAVEGRDQLARLVEHGVVVGVPDGGVELGREGSDLEGRFGEGEGDAVVVNARIDKYAAPGLVFAELVALLLLEVWSADASTTTTLQAKSWG